MPVTKSRIDLAVVGGGPSGALCALLLSREGARVSLVHWGGYAPDGIELVSGRACRLMEQYVPDFFRKATFPRVEVHETISLRGTPEPVSWNSTVSPQGSGLAVERPLFDRALRELAQTESLRVVADAKVLQIDRGDDDRWQLLLRSEEAEAATLCADFVILATGRATVPFFGRAPRVESSKIALMTSLPSHGAPGHAAYMESTDNGSWYALPATDGGYFASFCIDRGELKKRSGSLKDFFVSELQRTQLLAYVSPSNSIDLQITGRMAGAGAVDKAAGKGWIGVGDAVYAPDPLSGTGIESAVESAGLGSNAVLAAMKGTGALNARAEFPEYEELMQARWHAQ